MNMVIDYNVLMPFFILFAGISLTAFMGAMGEGIKKLSGIVGTLVLAITLYWFVWKFMPALSNEGIISYMNGIVQYSFYSIFLSILVLLSGIFGFVLAEHYLNEEDFKHPEFYSIMLSSIAGMLIMINTDNFIQMFIGLEIMSIPLYASVAYFRYKAESIEGGLKYFILGAIASGFFAFGIAFIYGGTGSVVISEVMKVTMNDSIFKLGLIFIIVGFAFKASAVPFHMWTPDAYEGAPTPVTAIMSTAPKAVAIGVLIKVLYLAFAGMSGDWQHVLIFLSILTVIIGNFAALVQNSVKRMLAYSSIAHAGYLLMGVVAFSKDSAAAILFYLTGYVFINMGAFGILTLFKKEEYDFVTFENIRGLGYKHPFAGVLMSVFMFSLAGIPATVGFMGKFFIFRALIDKGFIWLTVIGVFGSLVSVYYYLKVVVNMFMKEEVDESSYKLNFLTCTVLAICAVFIFYAGIFPAKLINLAEIASRIF